MQTGRFMFRVFQQTKIIEGKFNLNKIKFMNLIFKTYTDCVWEEVIYQKPL